ncbi:MAG: cation:proton antiporter [Phycisphaerales bacterium]|nr:MAG: cation:proton antiporter [Phycisphaerales bacterium]
MVASTLAATTVTESAVIADLLVILASAAIIAIVMQRMRLAVIPAYLITGAVIGPDALGLVPTREELRVILHLAIILLLFGVGLELHVAMLKPGLSRMVAAGLGSCGVSVLVGWPVAMRFGLSAPAALAISMGLSLSSTAVVLRILTDRRELQQANGRLALSILVIQDLIVLGMLASLPALATWSGVTGDAPSVETRGPAAHGWLWFLAVAAARVGGVAMLLILGRLVLPRLLRESLRGRSLEVLMTVGVAAALAAAVVTQAIGFSLEMGAFLAGFVLAGTPFRHQLSGQIGPLRDLFIAVFFATLGMELNLGTVMEWWLVVIAGVAVLAVLKGVLISATCWASGAAPAIAVAVGLSLAQAGEFSLILLGAAHERRIITDEILAVGIAIVVISLILTPGMVNLGSRLGQAVSGIGLAPWIASSLALGGRRESETAPKHSNHVVVAGYGPIGRRIAEKLDEAGIPFTIVELNPATVREQTHHGRPIIFGDIGNIQVLESAGIGHADALILTIPDEEAALRACAAARRRVPGLFIATRTRVVSKQAGLMETGADHVTVDEMAAAEAMLHAVVARIDATAEKRWEESSQDRQDDA